MSVTDELLQNNERYAASFDKGDLPLPPAKGVAIVACMDVRLNVYGMLGLEDGDTHVIRNAGGVITDDEIRSLAISQRLLGTREVILLHHTDCGMLTFSDEELREQIQQEVGIKPHFPLETFADLEEDVRQSIRRIQVSPFISHKDSVRGFIYEVESGRHGGYLTSVPALCSSSKRDTTGPPPSGGRRRNETCTRELRTSGSRRT
jgi:carbonic anhydrase